MKREIIMQNLKDLQEKADLQGFKEQNEYDLFLRESIVDYIKSLQKNILIDFLEANNYFLSALKTKENAIKIVNSFIKIYKNNGKTKYHEKIQKNS